MENQSLKFFKIANQDKKVYFVHMNKCKLTIAILFLLFITNRLHSASFDPSRKYMTMETDHFLVHYPSELKEVAEKSASILEEVHKNLSKVFKWEPWGKTEIILSDSSEDANGISFILPYNWIHISVAQPTAKSSLAFYDDWLRLLLTHEYTHILHLDRYGGFWTPLHYIFGKVISPSGTVPLWVKEGIATYEETRNTTAGRGRSSFAEMMLRTAILNNKFLDISEAEGYNWKWPRGYARYIYGVKFLEYLAEKYGEDKVYEFLERTSKSPLIFFVNHHARKTFSNIEYESVKVHTRYSKRKKLGTPRSKSLYDLWQEWKEYLKDKYSREVATLKNEGITEFTHLAGNEEEVLASPTPSPDGKHTIFIKATPYGPASIISVDETADGEKKEHILLKKADAENLSIFPDGKAIVYSKAGTYKRYYYINDLYIYHIEERRTERLTNGARASDPDVSKYGRDIVCVINDGASSHIATYDLEKKEFHKIDIKAPQYTTYSTPRFSPNDQMIAVAVKSPNSGWDIHIYSRDGRLIKKVTNDFAIDRDPSWGPDGSLYFSSDRSGIPNIYRYDLKTNSITKVTNVLSGVFEPAVSPEGDKLFVQYYTGSGYDIREMQLNNHKRMDTKKISGQLKDEFLKREGIQKPISAQENLLEEGTYKQRKYSPFGKSLFLPRFIAPYLEVLDDTILTSFMTGSADPLRWHNWMGGVSYRSDADHVGYFFNYWYGRFRPIFSMGIDEYAVDYGTFRYATGTRSFHLYEKRRRGYIGVSYPIDKHLFGIQYFYERRMPTHVSLLPSERDYFNFGSFAGFNITYSFNQTSSYPASISREGISLQTALTVTDKALGSSEKNEQYIYAGDLRGYIPLFKRHVIALRAKGGISLGDPLRQGTFILGGALGEGTLAGGSSLYYIPLRGLPLATISATRALLLSAEYRLPIVNVGKGIGTLPLAVNDLHFAAFLDYGNAWNAKEDTGRYFFDNFLLGVGGELRADLILGYGLPITGRIGYGIIVVNRDRLNGLVDPVFKQSARNGVFIMQLGTSF